MNELSLFSGAGGGVLASKLLNWRTIGYVEWDEYCQKVIAQRIKDKLYERAPIFTDVREFIESGAARQYRGFVDVVSAGFPCQPSGFIQPGTRLNGESLRCLSCMRRFGHGVFGLIGLKMYDSSGGIANGRICRHAFRRHSR